MTIREFYQGIFNFPVSEEMISSACSMMAVEPTENISYIDIEFREMILAHLLVMLSRASMGYSNKTGTSDFSMIIQGELVPLSDRLMMRNEANRIFKKWDRLEYVTESNAINV